MRTILNHFAAQEIKFPREINPGISQTIPDQAISPEELIRQYRITGAVSLSGSPIYDEDDYDLPDFHQMDALDKLHAAQENAAKIRELQNTAQYEQEKKKHDEQLAQSEANKAEATTTQHAEQQANKTKSASPAQQEKQKNNS